MSSIHDFHASAADWRHSIRVNRRRTIFVVTTFILIYIMIGLLIDVYLAAGHYPQAPLSQIFYALITFHLMPKATLATAAIAVISLYVTFAFHDKLMLLGAEYHEVTAENADNLAEKQLYNTVEEMQIAAGIKFMPKVYIINADYMNAFASGYSEKSAMIAITRGLLEKLDRDELQAVVAHEMSHIRHMDIKLTLMASVLANIMLIIVDVLFFTAIFGGRSDREGNNRNQLFFIILILRYLLPLLTVILMLYLSRTREYMADAGCVELMRNNEPLARALLKIQDDHTQNSEVYGQAYSQTPHESIRRSAYIFDPLKAGIEAKSSLSDFFSTHPSITKRLMAIGFKTKE
jgi:heat shock protein HtpX